MAWTKVTKPAQPNTDWTKVSKPTSVTMVTGGFTQGLLIPLTRTIVSTSDQWTKINKPS